TFDNTEYESFPCRMITLDYYLTENRIREVNFVKMDTEGAEMMMLEGADKLFDQKRPPIWEIEMALATTRGFDYLPNDLIKYMRQKADYEFYAIDEINFGLYPIEGFYPEDQGANVLCLPKGHYRERLSQLKIQN
ncbi:MAG: FkbM family methyltransferase, partial [Pyrinomonadaceae bacterium]